MKNVFLEDFYGYRLHKSALYAIGRQEKGILGCHRLLSLI
ncbi:hypothetical protein H04402_00604 [Clostridium botulinum H04402 065]|nr:hypothetical protein H04402_00604 [Clostridium botulinum H04402 065]